MKVTNQNESYDTDFSNVKLQGHPYVQHDRDLNVSLDRLVENTRYKETVLEKVQKNYEYLLPLKEEGFFSRVDRKLKSGADLNFTDAFSAAAFVCASLNNPLREALERDGYKLPPAQSHLLQSTALLSNLSTKESLTSLTSDEIAGLVGATVELDTIVRIPHENGVLCFGGMGGDKGYNLGKESKLFSLSTLAAFGAALTGPTHKHHSYPNTSKVAGQTTLESFGARSDFVDVTEMAELFRDTSLLMTSCHNTRSIHFLSHILRGETINHVIGPMAYTIDAKTSISPFVGVNEKVHPETVVKSFLKMAEMGIQEYDCGVVFCGLTTQEEDPKVEKLNALLEASHYYSDKEARSLVALDEVAPPPFYTLASFFVSGEFKGNYILKPDDFYSPEDLEKINIKDLLIVNKSEDILAANDMALRGHDESKMRYLAMTIGLARFVQQDLVKQNALDVGMHQVNTKMLRKQTSQAFNDLASGKVFDKVQTYSDATNQMANSINYMDHPYKSRNVTRALNA